MLPPVLMAGDGMPNLDIVKLRAFTAWNLRIHDEIRFSDGVGFDGVLSSHKIKGEVVVCWARSAYQREVKLGREVSTNCENKSSFGIAFRRGLPSRF